MLCADYEQKWSFSYEDTLGRVQLAAGTGLIEYARATMLADGVATYSEDGLTLTFRGPPAFDCSSASECLTGQSCAGGFCTLTE
ncbi:MAG: hypothetical protein AB8I08_05620 [Sandaracinaceae bacterium]